MNWPTCGFPSWISFRRACTSNHPVLLLGVLLWCAPAPSHAQCDPAETAKWGASDAEFGDRFGSSIAVSGDTAVIGAVWDDLGAAIDAGSVYVFVRIGGAWVEQQKLSAPNPATNGNFGGAVAIAGDTLVVRAREPRSVSVFIRVDGLWAEQQTLTSPVPGESDGFGAAVAVSGETIVVGARTADQAATHAGVAYVFTRTDGIWSHQQTLTASDAEATDFFGGAVALCGDRVLVGATGDDNAGGTNAGAVYAFAREGEIWTEIQKLVASDPGGFDEFGSSIAWTGDTAVIGVRWDDIAGLVDAGSAYVFTFADGVWSEQQKLTASDGALSDNFGYSVAVWEDTALIGAYFTDRSNFIRDVGSAYLFRRNAGLWIQQPTLLASDGSDGDMFGSDVALSGDTALVAAFNDRDAGFGGAVYSFDLGCTACPGDLNRDSMVGLGDLTILLSHFGTSGGYADGDLDGDGGIDLADLTVILTNFGALCP